MKYDDRRKTLAKKNVIAVAALAMATIAIVVVFAAITSTQTVPSHGTIAGINLGVYTDSACTNQLYQINWTTVSNGTSVTQPVYIENKGTTAMTLNMTTTNWVNQSGLTITWDKEGTNVNPGVASAVLATLTLTASTGFTTGIDFTVDINIKGSA